MKLYMCYSVISEVGSSEISGGAFLVFADHHGEALAQAEETVRNSLTPGTNIKEIKSDLKEVPVSTIERAAIEILGWRAPSEGEAAII